MPTIHPTAIVHPAAQLAESAQVGPYCVVGPDVAIGAGTILHNHVTIASLTEIGSDNVIHAYAVIGDAPQDRKFGGERTTLTIGDNNIIREHVTIHRGTANGGGVTQVGNSNLIMVMAHIAHDCRLGDHIVLANQVMLAGHVRVEDGATISASVGVHHYATVGTCSFIGGLARIPKDVPPYMIVEGNPAEVRGWNRIAMERRGYAECDLDAIREAYKRLFRDNGAPMSERLAALRDDYPQSRPVQRLCESVRRSAEGVHGRALEVARPDDKHAMRLDSIEDGEFDEG